MPSNLFFSSNAVARCSGSLVKQSSRMSLICSQIGIDVFRTGHKVDRSRLILSFASNFGTGLSGLRTKEVTSQSEENADRPLVVATLNRIQPMLQQSERRQ